MFGEQSHKRFVKYKNERIQIEELIDKINLCIQLKAAQNLGLIKIILKRIELARKIFIMNIEIGLEVLIPKQLTMQNLPMNFRYYDPIQLIVRELISEDRKELFQFKNAYNMKRMQETDAITIILKKFKIYDAEAEEKLTFKPEQINQRDMNQIAPWESEHATLLQRSGYVVID